MNVVLTYIYCVKHAKSNIGVQIPKGRRKNYLKLGNQLD